VTFVLDPVWPWSRLWEALQEVPPALRVVAGMAAAAAFALPILHFARSRMHWRASTASVLLMSLLLVSQHTWAFVYTGCREATGSGFSAFFLAIAAHLGLFLLLVGPPALAGLSVATYLGTPGLTRRGLAAVAGLRLLAFLLTLIAVARPSLGWSDDEKTTTQLFLLLDHSRSMTVQDERGNQSRWELLQRALAQAEPALTRLRVEQQVEVKAFRFAEELLEASLDALGEADGKRTDAGLALRALFDRRDGRVNLRGVLLVGDGADNGGTPALAEATRWRGTGAALSTFACGNPSTTPKQRDIAVTAISTAPSPFVPIKGKLTVKLTVDARGYENTKARVRLFLESDGEDREVLAKDVPLPLTTGNEVTLETDAPAKPGEVKVKAVVESAEPDKLPLNNSIETFVTVSKEGISVLLVDRSRAHEPQMICDALAGDPRIRVTPVWVRGGRVDRQRVLDDTPFDVILLGDVTAAQLRGLDPEADRKIKAQVKRGAGLMVLGGYVNLGNGGWENTELRDLLPVDLSEREQVDKPVRMVPTRDGERLARYLLRLEDNPDLGRAWANLAKLDGMTVLRLPPKPTGLETVLAETEDRRPLLVMGRAGATRDAEAGAARILVFGGDTTYRWVRSEGGQRLHERFWRQAVVWLARQEDAEGSVWVRPDVRRLPVRSELGFAVGMRGKGGGADITDGKFEVEVVGPGGAVSKVPLTRSPTRTAGTFADTRTPGVYKITVRGEGKDASGAAVSGESSARVIVYDEDLELARPAADPEFLKKLAAAGGGEALRVEQLADYLSRLAEQPMDAGKPKMELRPDWRTTNRSAFLVCFFVAFCAVVSLEWGLRRRWGMV
jgi:uncharacterized membrane protein